MRTVADILQILQATGSVGWSQTYVGKNYTKQDLINDLQALDDTPVGGWHLWEGGEQPPVEEGTYVDVQYRSGDFAYYCRVGYDSEGAVEWRHLDDELDIVGYRLVERK